LFIISSKYFFESDKVVFDVGQDNDLSESPVTQKLVQLKVPTEITLCE